MNLSTNFTLSEFTSSQTASRDGIDNTPDAITTEALRMLCTEILQPLRDKFGRVRISSGYRSPALNKAIKGAKNSDHMYGQAADISVPGVSNFDLAVYIRDNLTFKQCILEFPKADEPEAGWVHVSYAVGDLKKECLTAVKQNGKTVYLKGIVL